MKKVPVFLFTVCLFSFLSTAMLAQSSAEKKLDNFINALEQTKFIKEYKEYKGDMEALVAELKLAEANEKEVAKVKIAYNQSKARFDVVLDQVKRDIVNKNIRQQIMKSPDGFTKQYQKRLDDAKVYCNDNFKKKAMALLPQKDAMDAETLELLVGSFFTIFKSFSEKKEANDVISATYLETNLIEPLRFKEWSKIE